MKTVVLMYEGTSAGRQFAEDDLRRQVPGILLTAKTQSLIEAQVEDDQLPELKRVSEASGWSVSLPTFAEIRPPSLNLKNLRAKLSGTR